MENTEYHHQKVISYFKESELGYDIVLGGAKHFGYYPDGINNITEKRAQELMQDLAADRLNIKKNQLILDAGCGQGIVSSYLARKHHCKIIGITIVPFEVDKAAKLAKKLALNSNVSYYLMDYSSTDFESGKFDAIYAMESFVHSPDARATLKEFFRILRPGGKLAVFDYTISEDAEFTNQEREMFDVIVERTAMGSIRDMRHKSFVNLLSNAGFKSVKQEDITKNFMPSVRKLNKLAKIPYIFVDLLRLQKHFINVTAAIEVYNLAKKGLFRYNIFTAEKPRK